MAAASVHRIQTSAAYRVEKGVPFAGGRGRNRKYPLGDMEVGDSFAAPKSERETIRAAVSYWGKRHGNKFAVHTTGPDEVRCWRTA